MIRPFKQQGSLIMPWRLHYEGWPPNAHQGIATYYFGNKKKPEENQLVDFL
jgi:hypothetical protein